MKLDLSLSVTPAEAGGLYRAGCKAEGGGKKDEQLSGHIHRLLRLSGKRGGHFLLQPKVRRYIQEALWHHTNRSHHWRTDSEIRVSVADPRVIMWWAFQWGSEAEIMEPEWLRKETKDSVRQMGVLYER